MGGLRDEKCIPDGENEREKRWFRGNGRSNGRNGTALRDVNLHLQSRFPFSPSQVFPLANEVDDGEPKFGFFFYFYFKLKLMFLFPLIKKFINISKLFV